MNNLDKTLNIIKEKINNKKISTNLNDNFLFFKKNLPLAITYYNKKFLTKNENIIKTSILSKKLIKFNIHNLYIKAVFNSTTFSSINETVEWNLELEQILKSPSYLQKKINLIISENNQNKYESINQSYFIRYQNLINQDLVIFDIITQIKQQIPNIEEQDILNILAFILIDFERISSNQEKEHYHFQNLIDENKTKICCLISIKATYKKLQLQINT